MAKLRSRFDRPSLLLAWLLLTLFLLESILTAGAQPTVADVTSNEAHAAVMKAMASKYELTAGGGGMQKLELIAEPVQRWSNPIRGQLDGCLFLWTLAGQPQAALSLYPTLDRAGWNHQFQSLSTGPLVATLDGAVAWIPDQPGIDYQTVPNAPAPADSAPRRLSQMRGMARRFTATVDTRGDKTALRLLTSPIYRYGREEGDPVDGAMFAWVQATDPELLLLLEARGSGDNCRWAVRPCQADSVAPRGRLRIPTRLVGREVGA